MPKQEVLILAMTRMKAGICTAGFAKEAGPDGVRVRWVRPVKEFGAVLLGDMTDADRRVVQINDVVELNLLQHRPDRPHVEDWITDFVRERPRRLYTLDGEKRARFLAAHCDPHPADVLVHHTRSLCMIRPESISASFRIDGYSGRYEARIEFAGGGLAYTQVGKQRDVAVTDLKWRALGRRWLAADRAHSLRLSYDGLLHRLQAETIYLTIGLSRSLNGAVWPLIVGVHAEPDYMADIDYTNL